MDDAMGTWSRKAVRRAAVGGALGIMLVIAAGAAAFAEDDDDEDTIEMRAIKSIMRGLGANVDGARIDYRERSPLVIPPTRDLPPPQEPGSVNTAAWPNDPDQRKPVKKAARPIVNGSIATQQMESPERSPMVSPGAIANGAIPGQKVTAPDPNANTEPGRALKPWELGFGGFGNLFGYKAEQAPFTGEPTRSNLVQPPAGYQTPSPNYPYGVGIVNNSTKEMPMVKDRAAGAN
jgi:hypothetical protein